VCRTQLAAHVLARAGRERGEVFIQTCEANIEDRRRQSRLPAQAVRACHGCPQFVLRGCSVLDGNHAHALGLCILFHFIENRSEQALLLRCRAVGREAEMADLRDRRAERQHALREQAREQPVDGIGDALERPAECGVEPITDHESRYRGAQCSAFAHTEIQPGEPCELRTFGGAIIAPVLEFLCKERIPFVAPEGLDRIRDDDLHYSVATATCGSSAGAGMCTKRVAAMWLKKRVERSMTLSRS